MAHIGGFIAGMILVFLFRTKQKSFTQVDEDNDSYYRPY
jgi:hypothetical protein